MKSQKVPPVVGGRWKLGAIALVLILSFTFLLSQIFHFSQDRNVHVLNIKRAQVEVLTASDKPSLHRDVNCSFWTCFDIYACGYHPVHQNKMGVYVYPLKTYTDLKDNSATQLTQEYYYMLEAITNSEYYTPNPKDACIFVPSIDMLNQIIINEPLVGQALNTLPFWNNGQNHLIFNYVPGIAPNFNRVLDVPVDKSIIAGAGFDTWTYRPGFDVSLPLFSTKQHLCKRGGDEKREFLLVSPQLNIYEKHRFVLQNMAYENLDILVLQHCKSTVQLPSMPKSPGPSEPIDYRCAMSGKKAEMQLVEYPEILSKSDFCLVIRGVRLAQMNLLDSLASGCIPVIIADNIILPFSEIIDWTMSALRIREADIGNLVSILRNVSSARREEMKDFGHFIYKKYFSTISKIVLTTLDIINGRVFAHHAKTYVENNLPSNTGKCVKNPLFAPIIPPRSHGFTAIILTYDRIGSLFQLVQKIATVPSLQKILVIWNNQKKPPPHPTMFPKINKPLKVIQTKANKLSNRFYPYEEIETEAILNIDDDIVMLTADELDFGYEVWREFPDRIVGFPSRTHVWDNTTLRWRYESEWTNQVSMVLTGAAFYHKVRVIILNDIPLAVLEALKCPFQYWNFVYTNTMPAEIKEFVDEHMNCEDIAMNFLVANITNKPPIKVAPRKKFKCPECKNTEMLSADLNHMMERTACINRFASIYGTMPLKSVEYRADPVLYKDSFPEKLKRFNDIGSL